jgi:hypothetical protein
MPRYGLEQIMRAQAALRNAAGIEPEQFPVEAFVGMVSDEVQILRNQGRGDEEIVGIILASSGIEISPATLAQHYASAEDRHGPPRG